MKAIAGKMPDEELSKNKQTKDSTAEDKDGFENL